MDIQSLLRTFRYTELQQKAEHDPKAKRPPTIKFLGIALALGLIALSIVIFAVNYEPAEDGTNALDVPTESDPAGGNATSSPTPGVPPNPALDSSGDAEEILAARD